MGFKKGEVPHNKGDAEVKRHFRNTKKSPDRKKMSDVEMLMSNLRNQKNTIHGTTVEM